MAELPAALIRALSGADIKTGVGVTRLTRDEDGGYLPRLDDGTVLPASAVDSRHPRPGDSRTLVRDGPGGSRGHSRHSPGRNGHGHSGISHG